MLSGAGSRFPDIEISGKLKKCVSGGNDGFCLIRKKSLVFLFLCFQMLQSILVLFAYA